MKKIVSFFIKYPVSVNIVLIAIVVFGTVGMLSMNSSFFPLTESSKIRITTNYPGASPQEMEEGIVLKIEDNLRGLEGIDQFTSVSSENFATITVEKIKDFDIEVLLADVKNAVDKVASFPSGMEPPIVQKIETYSNAISLVVTGENIPLKSLKIAARDVENQLKNIDLISQVELFGFPEEELEIAVNEEKLLAYNLSIEDIAARVGASNILTTGGSVKTPQEEYLIRANNRYYFAEEIDNIVVKSDNSGNIVRLKDVARVKNQFEESPNRSYYNGNLSVGLDVKSTNNEDMIAIAAEVQEYVKQYNEHHSNLSLKVTSDRSKTVVERTNLLLKNGAQGIFMVLILLSLFLKPRLAFWVAAGLPVSFFGMFMMATYFGITINVLSLFGMIIVIGILVDDGIVIAENIFHHYEKGEKPIEAAIKGTLEVTPPIFSAVLTTIIAFSMFFFIDGRVGQFFGEVALVVLLTLGISLIEALIILPSHVAHSDALKRKDKTWIFNKYADNVMNKMRDWYGVAISFFMRYKFLGFSIPLALMIITIGGMKGGIIKFTFFPNITSDKVDVRLNMPQGTNETTTDSIINYIEAAVWEMNALVTPTQTDSIPVVENIIKTMGPGSSVASLRVNLLPGDRRDKPAPFYGNIIDSIVGEVIGAESLEYGANTSFGGKPISVSLAGENIKELKAAKEELKKAIQNDDKFINVSDNDPLGIKEINIQLKENAYLLGFNYNSIMSQIRAGFFGRQVQRLQLGQDELKVWVRYDEDFRSSINNLDKMRITSATGSKIPLSELVTYEVKRGEVSINHLDGRREIKVSSDIKDPKASATEMLELVKKEYVQTTLAKYPTVDVIYGGQNRTAEKTGSSAKKVFPIILFLIYVIIVFTFRSFSQPLILLLMIPFSLIGVAWGHYIHAFPVNILSLLGIIALVGILVNDGLVLIEKFNSFLKKGLKFEEALIEAGKSRFRAIFLTTITTVAGLFPLIVLETSRQAQFLIPMAIAIAYGILVATFMTLFLLPILLSFSNYIKVGAAWLWTGKKPTRESVERAIKEMVSEKEDGEY
ncbi:MAG: efflux RND transporter permease subunit [Chitinophagales bacterium]